MHWSILLQKLKTKYMKTSIPTCAEMPKDHLSKFIKQLVDKFQPLYVYCFGKITETTSIAGCFVQEFANANYQYFLLMVTESITRIDHEVQEYANTHYSSGSITILSHGQHAIKEAINNNNRFFLTIYNNGQLLYSHNGMRNLDFNRKFIPTHSASKAQQHFDHRIFLAEGFLHGASECLNQQDNTIATFLLHQAVEQCCIVLIRVHLAYRSEIHNLSRMLSLCRSFSDRPIKTFISNSPEDKRLFNILLKSYSDSRYGSSFCVSQHDAQFLYDRILSFVILVKEMCCTKIQELAHEALLFQELEEIGAGELN